MPTIIDSSETRVGSIRIRTSGRRAVIEETYAYIIQADSVGQTRIDIAQTPGLPTRGITTSSGGLTLCNGLSANRRVENPLIWDVQIDFSSDVQEGSNEPDPSVTPPEMWVPVYETKYERLQETVTKDKAGESINNSAGQPYETGLTITRSIPIWYFYQFESASVTDEDVIARNETVNENVFKGRAEQTLLCTVESSVIGFYYGQRRRLTYYCLKYNKNNWKHKRLDVGTYYYNGTSILSYTDEDGNVIMGPLDGNGGKVTAGQGPEVREFEMYEISSFSFLRV